MTSEAFAVSVIGLMHERRFRAGFGPFCRGRESIVQATQAQFEKLCADPCLAVVKVAPECNEACKGLCRDGCPCPADPQDTAPEPAPETDPKPAKKPKSVKTAKNGL